MKKTNSPIIQADELVQLCQQTNVILIDADNGPNAKSNYQESHLKGALWVDLNIDLANINEDVSIGGRHPLPTIKQFSATLGSLGISPSSHVVVYDRKNGSNAAARFWWMLKAVGHADIQVLNGGFQEAVKAGFPVSTEITTVVKQGNYPLEGWNLPLVNLLEVENATKDKNYLIIDVRDEERYNGNQEPIDLIAGHIPTAINIPFVTNLHVNGLFLSPIVLEEQYKKALGNVATTKIIVHCGSGVTACHSLLAMAYAGLEIPNLYVGSWSEWSRNDKEMVTNKKK